MSKPIRLTQLNLGRMCQNCQNETLQKSLKVNMMQCTVGKDGLILRYYSCMSARSDGKNIHFFLFVCLV